MTTMCLSSRVGGWAALVEYNKALPPQDRNVLGPPSKIGEFVTKFKLQLASYGYGRLSGEALLDKLTTRMIITDSL